MSKENRLLSMENPEDVVFMMWKLYHKFIDEGDPQSADQILVQGMRQIKNLASKNDLKAKDIQDNEMD
jgi:hypothetical protein